MEHLYLLRMLWKNVDRLVDIALRVGAIIIQEWPRGSKCWLLIFVRRTLIRAGMRFTPVDGCMVGVKSINPKTYGMPIKKPWLMATNSPLIAVGMMELCNGLHEHVPCQGIDTLQTQNYSDLMVARLHILIAIHIS